MQSRREAVQPSLLDRLVDELPGLAAETDRRRSELAREVGAERLDRIMLGGHRALEQEVSLDQDERRALHVFVTQMQRRRFLEERAIVVTPDVLREAVRRDIEALFNTERMQSRILLSDVERAGKEDPEDLLADFPEVRRSVLNYGVPSFAGRRAMDFDPEALSRELKEVVAVFEPRFRRDSIRVTLDTSDSAGFRIAIEGILMLSPVPERLKLSTSIDLDNGSASTKFEDI
jgi:type VI secretion system protein ImpF